MKYEQAIRHSNTIFSTMVCPKCGSRLNFSYQGSDKINVFCPKTESHLYRNMTVPELCAIINTNGLNQFVTPSAASSAPESVEKSEAVPPPPDGFKVEDESCY